MATYYVDGNVSVDFQTTTAYTEGQMVRPTNLAGTSYGAYECTVAGTSGGTEPSWPTSGTVVSGTATFTYRSGADGWTKPAGSVFQLTNRISGTVLAAGDVVLIDDGHSETAAAAATIGNATIASREIVFISVDKATNLPSAGAVVKATTDCGINTSGSFYGINFKSGDGSATSGSDIIVGGNGVTQCNQIFTKCSFELTNSDICYFRLGNTTAMQNRVTFNDCTFKAALATDYMYVSSGVASFNGGGIDATSAAMTTFVSPVDSIGKIEFNGFDFSALASTAKIIGDPVSGTDTAVDADFTGCKYPTSPARPAGTYAKDIRASHKGGNGFPYEYTNYQGGEGLINHTTAVYKSATIDGQAVSWYITTGSTSTFTQIVATDWIAHWLPAGTYTLTMHTLVDAAQGLPEYQCYLEVNYSDSATKGLLATKTSMDAVDPTTVDDSGDETAWTKGAAGTGWIAQEHSVTLTTTSDGYAYWRAVVHGPSQAVYVDPSIEVA